MNKTNNGQHSSTIIFVVILFLGVFALFYAATNQKPVSPVSAQAEPASEQGAAPNCRYGVSSGLVSENPFIDALRVGWILNFGSTPGRVVPPGVEYVPMVRMKQNKTTQGVRLPSYTITTQPLTDNPGGLGPLLASYPGKLWIVGNEVDREAWQDDMEPYVYARAYHDVYHFIKQRDPSAKVGISGLVQVTPNRLEYLDMVWDSYVQQFGTPMPVDVWTFHIYIFPEARLTPQGQIVGSYASIAVGTPCYDNRDAASCTAIKWESDLTPTLCSQNSVYCNAEHDDVDIFIEQLLAMRQWMKAHGQQQKPLLLSEFSLLHPFTDYDHPINPTTCYLRDEFGGCFTAVRVNQFMQDVMQYMETAVDPNLGYFADNNRLVQQWLWYSITIPTEEEPGAASRLVSLDGNGNPVAFTAVGQMFQAQVASRPIAVNLLPINASTIAVNGVTSATVSVDIVNNGNTQATSDYTVSFYRNSALTDLIASVTVPQDLNGCAADDEVVSVSWDGLVPGVNYFWARVSSNEDNNPADDITMGLVIVDPEQTFLPIITR